MIMARSEEHTSELQSPVVISYAVFCLKKKNKKKAATDGREDEFCYAGVSFHYLRLYSAKRRLSFFFFNDTAPTEIYTTTDTLSLHDALPISRRLHASGARHLRDAGRAHADGATRDLLDRKSTRLNSSHRLLSRMPSSA